MGADARSGPTRANSRRLRRVGIGEARHLALPRTRHILRGRDPAATELRAPLIVQTSVKTVKSIGLRPLFAMFRAYADPAPIPIALHLDHCPDRAMISACLQQGYNSVLFDGSHLPSVEENKRQTREVVAEARRYGAHVEGEIEGILGVEDGVGSDLASDIYSVGVIFYQMLTGQHLFDGETAVEVALHHLNTQPPQLPDQFSRYQRLMDKLIEKDRDARFRNADEVIGFLSRKFGVADADVTQKLS